MTLAPLVNLDPGDSLVNAAFNVCFSVLLAQICSFRAQLLEAAG